ncbi:hypothetical protein KFU94_06430 [Chloroflexi bacterium TSY]|nr:hypothetical protein [Chloroflexi bacterium TSY]
MTAAQLLDDILGLPINLAKSLDPEHTSPQAQPDQLTAGEFMDDLFGLPIKLAEEIGNSAVNTADTIGSAPIKVVDETFDQ